MLPLAEAMQTAWSMCNSSVSLFSSRVKQNPFSFVFVFHLYGVTFFFFFMKNTQNQKTPTTTKIKKADTDLTRVFFWRASWQLSAVSKFTCLHGLASSVAPQVVLPLSCTHSWLPELTASAKHSLSTSHTTPLKQVGHISQAWLEKLPVKSCMTAIEQLTESQVSQSNIASQGEFNPHSAGLQGLFWRQAG